MAFQGAGETPASSSEDHALPPGRPSRSNSHRPASVVSSRMTDIASDDEEETTAAAARQAAGRPETAKTGASYKGTRAGGARKNFTAGLPPKRGSITSTTSGLHGGTPSLTSRSHVPSLTSNAFFHPMSSQKLQAQRAGAARPPPPPPTTTQPSQLAQMGDFNDNATDIDGSVIHDLASLSNHIAPVQHIVYGEDNRLAPPSRGTEMTEQETFDRTTGTTSTSQGNHAAGSMTDSIRPLHKTLNQDKAHPQLNLKTDKSFRDIRIPSPVKSPRSFSSSFLIPGRGDHTSQNRNTNGAEKLSSVASSPRLNPVDSQRSKTEVPSTPTQQPAKGRNYEYFEGNTAFYFGGRWQNTRQRPINIATGLFVIVPCVLFFVFEAAWLWKNVSPAIPIIFAYLAYICFSSFIHASVSDPGILPRNLHQFPPLASDEDPLRVDPPTNDWTLIRSAEPTAAAMEVPVKHCRTCNIWRPPRAHHCRLCDNCVETHDHHCVWLNNCVGKRNYRLFFTFVSSGTLLAAYLIATSLAQLLVYMDLEGVSFGQAIDHFRAPFALVIIGFLAFCYPAALMGYHVFLMVRGETTREFMNSHKFAKKERYRAFSQGSLLRNILSVLCRPRSPTYYRFKNKYQTGDQRLGVRRARHHLRHNSQGVEMEGFQGPVALRGAVQEGQ